jgi:transcriptional regulator with XRE-family HTH domain
MNIGDERLVELMRAAGVSSFAALCKKTGVSEKALRRLRRLQLSQMQVVTLGKIAGGLDLSLERLVQVFSEAGAEEAVDGAEMVRVQALQVLEPWLLQWSGAVYAAQQNPAAPAVKLVPLMRPVELLVESWGLVGIGSVGEVGMFDPLRHEGMEEGLAEGDRVRVVACGYSRGDRLLYRARVVRAIN